MAQLSPQRPGLALGGLGPPRATGKPMVRLASGTDESLHVFAELVRVWVGRSALEQSQFLLQFLGLGFDVGETGLAVLGLDLDTTDDGKGQPGN
jgi:hypothetical protein